MIKQNIPYFEVDGERYEIKRNRYLQAEFDLLQKEIELSEDEKLAYEKEQEFDETFDKLKRRKDELYEKYLETFDENDHYLYLKANDAYELMLAKANKMESISAIHRKRLLDMGEKVIIKGLQMDKIGNAIRSKEDATNIWQSFVDENGKVLAIQFILFTMHYIIGSDEESENPFITQAKAKAEQRANMKKGIAKAK